MKAAERRICCGLVALVLVAAGHRAQAAGEPAEARAGTDRLLVAAWYGTVLTRDAAGRLCLVRGPEGSLRAEVAAGPSVTLDDLLDRRGEGWTVVLAAGGDGTLNPWDREWSRLADAAAAGLRVIAEALLALSADATAAQPGRPERRPATERHVLRSAEAPVGLRGRLARRARGRGGAEETLILTRLCAGDGGPVLCVRSSRRPGTLRCGEFREIPVLRPLPETFVPLWPLRDLLEFVSENPGTRHSGRG